MTDEVLKRFIESGERSDEEVVDHFVTYLLAVPPVEGFTHLLHEHYKGATDKVAALRQVILTILQSQYYQVC